MKKRMMLMLIVVAVFITAIGAVKYGQIKKGMADQANFQMPAEAVTTRAERSCSASRISALSAPRTLKDRVTCSDSSFSRTSASASADSHGE